MQNTQVWAHARCCASLKMSMAATFTGLFREFCGSGYAGCKMTRLRRRAKPARPYIWRLVCPERGGGSVGRVSEAMLHGR